MALTEETAWEMLSESCRARALTCSGANLLRIGSNAVFRLSEPIIVRISRDPGTMSEAQKQVAVARWLENTKYPATRSIHIDQPIEISGHAVTFWESVAEEETFAPIEDVANLIKRLHSLPAPPSLELPEYQPFIQLGKKLQDLDSIDPGDARFLRESASKLRKLYETLEFALLPGPIHGDANVGSVILSREGTPVLIDLDSFSTGPREWDLIQTALFYDRFGWHSEAEYRKFVDIYGFDIMEWQGYDVLASYRELSMVAWLAGNAAKGSEAAREVSKRVATLRTNGSRREWAPF